MADDALKAVKIEPHSNGPLFVEMNFYIRAALQDSVDEFMQVLTPIHNYIVPGITCNIITP